MDGEGQLPGELFVPGNKRLSVVVGCGLLRWHRIQYTTLCILYVMGRESMVRLMMVSVSERVSCQFALALGGPNARLADC